ncbi:IclR family transcriptional regulator [soil metagenome]
MAAQRSDPVDRATPLAGAQSTHRVLHLLRIVSLYTSVGITVVELSRHSGISRPTVHRMMACLMAEGFVERGEDDNRYRLGREAVNLGVNAVQSMPLVERYSLAMQRLARRSGDIVFLVFRQSDTSVCLHRATTLDQPPPSRMRVGERRLLGLGAGGIALLAKLPDEEIAEIYERNQGEYRRFDISAGMLERMVRNTRAAGYGIAVNSAIEGAAGVGIAVPAFNYPWAAISIGTQVARFTPARKTAMVDLLEFELKQVRPARQRLV